MSQTAFKGWSAEIWPRRLPLASVWPGLLLAHLVLWFALSACGKTPTIIPSPYVLQISVTGSGTVTSSPTGIDCGSDCSETYNNGTRVTLIAVPSSGYQFDGWTGGGCNGTGACVVTLNADITIIAAFSVITAPTCDNGGVIYDTAGTNGFGRQLMVNSGTVAAPIDIAFVPGSSTAFLVISQTGFVYYFDGGCDPVNTVDLRSVLPIGSSSGEQGLLNIEFHPDYAGNGYVFFYHTSTAGTVNSVSRMTVSFDGNGNLVLGNLVRIIDFRKDDTATATNHNGGGLQFAPDKTLLASVGDGGATSSTAQDDMRLLGKVIRISPGLAAGVGGYTIPGGNMFPSTNPVCSNITQGVAACPEILAKGLRNPFRLSIDGNIVYLGDVGSGFEEINSFGYTTNTVNFGWPTCEGVTCPSPPAGYRDPIVYYNRNDATAGAFRAEDPMGTQTGAASVMIGDVYTGSRYGGALDSSLLFGEFYDGFLRAVGVDGNGDITDLDGVPGAHVIHEDAISSMIEGPDGYVYMTALYSEPMVYRLVKP